jgi:hypothetical protein
VLKGVTIAVINLPIFAIVPTSLYKTRIDGKASGFRLYKVFVVLQTQQVL